MSRTQKSQDEIDMKKCFLGVAVAVAIGAFSTVAQAQVSPFSGRGPAMSTTDLDMMDKAAAPLFQGEGFTPGSVASWNNPASGWSGSVTAQGTTKVSGLPCRVLKYSFEYPERSNDSVYTVKWCRTKDGTWKLG